MELGRVLYIVGADNIYKAINFNVGFSLKKLCQCYSLMFQFQCVIDCRENKQCLSNVLFVYSQNN